MVAHALSVSRRNAINEAQRGPSDHGREREIGSGGTDNRDEGSSSEDEDINAEDSNSELAVLVCSANVGNAEPTPESFAEWVPDDGEIDGPLSQTKYPVEADGAEGVRASLSGGNKKFDIIVIGMQEAAFVEKRSKSSEIDADGLEESKSNGDYGAAGASENSQAQPLRANDIFGAVENRVAEAKKETKNGSHHVFKKIVKANMLVRGLTTSQTYKA